MWTTRQDIVHHILLSESKRATDAVRGVCACQHTCLQFCQLVFFHRQNNFPLICIRPVPSSRQNEHTECKVFADMLSFSGGPLSLLPRQLVVTLERQLKTPYCNKKQDRLQAFRHTDMNLIFKNDKTISVYNCVSNPDKAPAKSFSSHVSAEICGRKVHLALARESLSPPACEHVLRRWRVSKCTQPGRH